MSLPKNFSAPNFQEATRRQTKHSAAAMWSTMLHYTPAVLKHNARGYYIEYFVKHPDSGVSTRFRQNINMLHARLSQPDFRAQARVLVANLNARLASGWTPFANDGNALRYTPIREALYTYLDRKNRELREATLVAYKSVIDILLRFLDDTGQGEITIGNFTRFAAIRFLDYLGEDKDLNGKKKKPLSNNAWNTYLKKYSAIFGFLVERGYLVDNPFSNIRRKPKEDKRRRVVPMDIRRQILDYLAEHNPNYILVLLLIYSSLIRPKEIEFIRVEDVDIKNSWIHIPADNAKTHKERYAPLTPQICDILTRMCIKSYPPSYYLLGTHYQPSKTKAYHGKYKKDFLEIKRKLRLPEEIQLYSFKDTGISDMFAAGLDALTIMHAADHHDLSVTTRYACQANRDMIRRVREHAPELVQMGNEK